MQTNPVDAEIVGAMLQRGRTRMVQAVLNETGLVNAQKMYDHWQGFASCASSLLTNAAEAMALHDQASDLDGVAQATLARLPNDCERFSFADMKRLVGTEGVDLAADSVTNSNVDAVVQLQDGVRTVIKFDDKHAVAGIDVQDGCEVHGVLPVADAIVAHAIPAPGQPWPEQGGTYLGIAPAEGALPMRHLVVLDAEPATRLTWAKAVNWALDHGNGARLPTQLEAMLAYTVARAAFKEEWHWTGTQYSRNHAFVQDFEYGHSYWSYKDGEHRVRAFRGLDLQTLNPLTGDAAAAPAEKI